MKNLEEYDFNISKNVSNFLHFSRWMAALIVVLTHIRAMSLPTYNNLISPGIAEQIFYFSTSLGYQAVMIFFVLSGYLITGEVLKEMSRNTFSWKVYLTKRVTRLYIVLLPTLILTSILDQTGYTFFNQFENYDRYFNDGAETILTFIINIFMLQQSKGLIFGTNGPLWSLAYEFWYYLIFPLVLQILLTNSTKLKIVSIFFLLIILWLVNFDILLYFTVWLLGAIIWFIPKNTMPSLKVTPYLLTFIFVISIAISRYNDNYLYDLFVGIVFTYIILYFNSNANNQFLFRNFLIWKGHKYLANFSYSLYLFHYPIMILTFNILYIYLGDLKLSSSVVNLYILVLAILYVYILSYLLYYLFERNTKFVTTKILQKFSTKTNCTLKSERVEYNEK